MKKTTITIDGKDFTYNDEISDISYETISAISTEDAKELLETTKKLFDMCDIRFSLAFGTLLGAVRDNGIIKGDEDVDIFIESEEKLRCNLPFLYENGLKVCRIIEHCLYSFHTKNNSFIDVYIKDKLPFSYWSIWCYHLYKMTLPKWYVYKYDTINFLGIDCLVPHKPERILAFWYGKDWRIPISGHHYTYDTKSHYWWVNEGKISYETKKARLKGFIQRMIGWNYWKKYIGYKTHY